jgi:RecJ-like exonuclease
MIVDINQTEGYTDYTLNDGTGAIVANMASYAICSEFDFGDS